MENEVGRPARRDRPADPIEPLLDPFSEGTKRWIAILWILTAATWFLAVNSFPGVTISLGVVQVGPISEAAMRRTGSQGLIVLALIVIASAAADMVAVHQRRRHLRILSAEYEGRPKPEEERLLSALCEPTIRPIIATRLGIPILCAVSAWVLVQCA